LHKEVESRFPKPQESVLAVRADQVLMGMVTYSDDVFFVNVKSSLQFSSGGTETVEDVVFTYAVYPFTT